MGGEGVQLGGRSGRLVTTVIAVLLFLVALLLGFLMESLRTDRLTLSFVDAGVPVAATEIGSNHQRLTWDVRGIALLGGIAAVMWLAWQYRAHARARALVPGMRFTPAMGVASWFIPGVNLVAPLFAMRELWKAGETTEGDLRSIRTTPLLWVWWLAWLLAIALIIRTFVPVWGGAPSAADLMERDLLGVPAAGAAVVAALTGGAIVKWTDVRLKVKEFQSPNWRSWERDGRTASRPA
jgi:hypothetical protein